MEETKITKCPHCGGETHMQGVSFCPFCGNSLRGKTIVATNQSVKETVFEIEDSELKKIKGIEYPNILQGTMVTIVMIFAYSALFSILFLGVIVDLLIGKGGDKTIIAAFTLPPLVVVYLIFALVYFMKYAGDFKIRIRFKNGNKDKFSAEVRRYGSKVINGKEKHFITIKRDGDDVNAFDIYIKKAKRKFYIGEKVKVTVSNGVYLIEKADE